MEEQSHKSEKEHMGQGDAPVSNWVFIVKGNTSLFVQISSNIRD